jgi:hypothetical protein
MFMRKQQRRFGRGCLLWLLALCIGFGNVGVRYYLWAQQGFISVEESNTDNFASPALWDKMAGTLIPGRERPGRLTTEKDAVTGSKTKISGSSQSLRNVLFIVADDMRPELGLYGRSAITPNLDSLAQRGVTFDRAYAQTTVCNPSRVSFMTGRKPDVTQGLLILTQLLVEVRNFVFFHLSFSYLFFKKNSIVFLSFMSSLAF